MSYESDPSGQPLPGDSDSLHQGGHNPQENQGHWLLDDERTPLASQPEQPKPASGAKGQNWSLDGESAEEPSLVITEDTEGDSWLMNVDDPTVALEEHDASVQEHGLSASYCEPASTASTFSKLLVPTTFVAALSVGGLLVWRSMSGLGVGTDDSNTGAVVLDSSSDSEGEKLAGPTFEVPGASQSENGATLRGSIQRDGSVQQTTPVLTSKVAKGQFGFTPSSQNGSSQEAEAVASAQESSPNHETVVASDSELSEVVAEAPVEETFEQEVSPELQSEVSEGPVAQVDSESEESTQTEQEPFGLPYFAAEFEVCMSTMAELYQVQPDEGDLLSFEQKPEFTFPELPLWGPGTPMDPAIALGDEDSDADREDLSPEPATETLLSSEQENLLAHADADDSVELLFLFDEETPVEEESGDWVLAEGEQDEPSEHRFVDELLAAGPTTGLETVPSGAEGFELSPVTDWLEEGTEVAPELDPDASVDSPELASVENEHSDSLPTTHGFDEQGNGLNDDGLDQSEDESMVAVQDTEGGDQAMLELLSVPTVDEVASVEESDAESVVEYSVPSDSHDETMASIEPEVLGNPFFELEELGMVPVGKPVVFDWEDPLAGISMLAPDFISATDEDLPESGEDSLLSDSQDAEAQVDLVQETVPELEEPLLVSDSELDAALEAPEGVVESTEVQTGEEGLLEEGPVASNESNESNELGELTESSESTEVTELTESSEESLEEVPILVSDDSSKDTLVQVEETTPMVDQEFSVPSEGELPEMSTEFSDDGTPTGLVAAESDDADKLPSDELSSFKPVTFVSVETGSTQADAVEEQTTQPVQAEAPAGGEVASTTTNPEKETPAGGGERSLLDMYSDWNQAEDEGSLQSLSSSKWLNFSIGDGNAMPFRMAQSSLLVRREELPSEPVETKVEPEAKKVHKGVLKKRKVDENHWQGMEVPMHALSSKKVLLTPRVGPVRVIAVDGETLEGRLHGVGQNYVWLVTNLGRLSIPARRVERVERIDPAQFDTEVKSTRDYTKLPRVRVKMKGGVFVGHELAREGNRITIRTEKGHKMTLVSDDIQPVRARRSTGIKRRIE